MTILSTEELNLVCLYNAGNREETIKELRDMTHCLTPEETDLLSLAQQAMEKLKAMTDEEFSALDDMDLMDEDSAFGLLSPLCIADEEADSEIE